MASRIPNTAVETEVRQAFARLINDTDFLSTGAAVGSVLVGAGVGITPVWTTSLTTLTLLTVDSITINAATITSATGAISFDNENLTTTGTISGVNVTSGADPGHTHDARYFTETEHINTSAGIADAGKPIKLNASGLVDATMYAPGVTDHGALTGLSDDDHSQYHNDTRGDARYFTETEHLNVSAGAADAGKPIKLDAAGHVDATMINDGDIDHGSIGGLLDDDHTQYLLANGTRTLTDNMAVTALKTIDGRDLSVDGTKLDGIEALADVTDATNVAAAGALMSASHNLALHTALGLHDDVAGDARYFTEAEHISTSAGAADAGKPIKLNASGIVDSTMITSGSIDHGGTTGLGDDDHTQYLLVSGARELTGNWVNNNYGITANGVSSTFGGTFTKTFTLYGAADAYGIQVQATVTTGWITGWNYGFSGVGLVSGNVGDASMQVMGGIGRGYYQSSGTLGWLIGLKGDNYVWSATASGTINNMASFFAQSPTYGGGATATVDVTYGIYIGDRGVGTTRWAVYHTGTDKSRIGGRFGIGVDPTAMLNVTLSEAGTAARQDCVSINYTNTGTNSYNSIGRGTQGVYIETSFNNATNANAMFFFPQLANAVVSVSVLCALQTYTGYGYNAGATVGSARGLWIKSWGNTLPGTFTTQYGIKIENITGAATNYAIHTGGGLVVLNEDGIDSDTRIEGDNVANLFFCDAGNDKVGIGTATPDGKFDVNFTLAGTAAEQNLITGGFAQTGSNTYNVEGRGVQGLFINVLSHGTTNLNGIYIKPRGDNNFTIGTACGIQLYSFYGEDGVGCTLTTAIGLWIKGLGGTTPATWTNHYGLKIDAITGAATLNYAIHTTRGSIVFNDGGFSDSDVRMESDLDANCFFLDASADNIGIGTNLPTTRLDILNASGLSGLRLRTAKTPASGTDTGAIGEICWDVDYIYICTATNVWERAAIATW